MGWNVSSNSTDDLFLLIALEKIQRIVWVSEILSDLCKQHYFIQVT